jgi:uncharacterized repeat protein (TIGR01451 family)
VTDGTSGTALVIDTSTNTVVATIPVGAVPQGIAITPDGTRAYVANINSNNVSVIDTSTNTVVATIPVGVNPVGVAITPAPQPKADLAIRKFGFPGTVESGEWLSYLLQVHNLGPDVSRNVVAIDPLPAGTAYLEALSSQGSCTGPVLGSTGTVKCNLGNLANGAYALVGIVVKVTAAGGTTITNAATVSSSTVDPNRANNSATVRTAVAPRDGDE